MTHAQVSSDPDDLLGQVVDEFFQAVSLGETPDLADYLRRYPEIADLLKVAIPAMQAAEAAAIHSEPMSPTREGPPEKQLGDFRILRQLGRGGMGIVYEAEQISMKRRVALKVLPLAGLVDELKIHRFQNEVRAVAALDHPNVVSVFMVGEERGVHYYAMQLVRGRSLAQVIDSLREVRDEGEVLSGESVTRIMIAGPRDEESVSGSVAITELAEGDSDYGEQPDYLETIAHAEDSTIPHGSRREYFRSVAALGIQAASALQHAHDQGVIHRDIKPANLLLDRHSKLYVTDFGLARMEADAGVTMTGDLVGTLRYMAPEQALAKRVDVDHRADIYSLAATLYELLTLRPAYPAEDRRQLLKQIAFEEPARLRRIDPAIPIELETIVLKAMSKDMDDRYASAQALADDLRLFLDNRPVLARPLGLHRGMAKWTRRNPALTWAMAVAVLSVIVALSVSTVLVSRQRDVALQNAEQLRVSLQRPALGRNRPQRTACRQSLHYGEFSSCR